MTLFLTLTLAETNTGPFNLYSNVDGYVSAFATNVSKASLLAGFSIPNAPDDTVTVRVHSVGQCTNSTYLTVSTTTTTTTTL